MTTEVKEMVDALPRRYIRGDAFINKSDVLELVEKLTEPKRGITITNVSEVRDGLRKQEIIARLKKIGFSRMDEPNHYANDLGLSFAFDQNSKYSIANQTGEILISTDDIFEALKLLQPDVNAELLSELKNLCDVARHIYCFPR